MRHIVTTKISKGEIIKHFSFITFLALSFTDLSIITLSSVTFSFYFVFGLMGIIFITAIQGIPNLIKQKSFLLLIFFITSLAINPASTKITSLIYSIILVFYFIFYSNYIKKTFTEETFLLSLKIILYSFFFITIISQILVLTGFYYLDQPSQLFDMFHGPLGIIYEPKKEVWRFSSLSTEPSYAAFIVAISFWAYFILNNNNIKNTLLPGIITLYMLISFQTVYGLVLLIFIVSFSIKLNYQRIFSFILFALGAFFALMIFNIGEHSLNRLINFINLILSDHTDLLSELRRLDSSAFFRIGPSIIYYHSINLLEYQFYFGHGAASSTEHFSKILYGDQYPTYHYTPPFLPGFLYDYGLIGLFLIIYTLFSPSIKRIWSFNFFVIFIMLFNANLNTQLFWFIIFCLNLLNYYTIRNENIR